MAFDRPFRWVNRFMAVGDAVASPMTGRFLSNRRRNQESVLETTMRLEVVAHHASFTIPTAADGPAFDDVLEVRFWSDVERAEAHDTFYLAPDYGSVGAVRILAVRDRANLGDAWFDRIRLKRIAACAEAPVIERP